MSGLKDSQLLDLAANTLYDLGAPTIQLIAQTLQNYEVMGRIMKEEKIQFSDGLGVQKTLMLRKEGSAEHKGRYAEDNINVYNLLEQVKVDWCHIDAGWAWERSELEINRGKSLIANVVKPRRANALLQIFDGVEEKFWGAVSTDPLLPKGLMYWIVKNATAGFNGGLPSGYTDVGGINITKNPNFMNYTDQYTALSDDDLLDRMRLAQYKTNFKSPITGGDFKSTGYMNKRIYSTYSVINALTKLARQNNENLGPDLDVYNGSVRFNKLELVPVPQLDVLGLNDVYMINFDSFYPVVRTDNYLRESDPKFMAKSHNVLEQYIDLDYNYLCLDRRANAVIDDANT